MSSLVKHILRPSNMNRKWIVKGKVIRIIEDEDNDKYIIVVDNKKDFRLMYWNLLTIVTLKRKDIIKNLENTVDYHGNNYIRDIVNDWFRAQNKTLPVHIDVQHDFDNFILWKDILSWGELNDEIMIGDIISYELVDTYLELQHYENTNIVYVSVKHKLGESGVAVNEDDEDMYEDIKYYIKSDEDKIEETNKLLHKRRRGDDEYEPYYGPDKYDRESLYNNNSKTDIKRLAIINKRFKQNYIANSQSYTDDSSDSD